MAIGCGAKISKFLLFFFNVLFWISGLILIVTGTIYVTTGNLKYLEDIIQPDDRSVTKLMYVMIGLGCIVFLIGFCGCCGAIRESRFLLGIYIGLLLVIMIAEIASGIYAILKKNEVINKVDEQLGKAINKHYPSDRNLTHNQNLKKAIDYLQQSYNCCGVKDRTDWQKSNWYKERSNETKYKETPLSCCPSQVEDQARLCFSEEKYFKSGCSQEITNFFKSKFPIVIGILVGIALFEILVVIFAFCLCNNTGQTEHSTI